jgi:hypothetical protein
MSRTQATKVRGKRSATAALVASALLLAGCARNGHSYHDRSMDFGAVRAVAVLPLANLTRETAASERVRDVLANLLLASGSVYVLPSGEVARGISRAGLTNPSAPSAEEVVKIGTSLKVDAVIVGVVKEYGEVRSGSATANVCSVAVQMLETTTGKVIWTASTTKGGVTLLDRMLGGGGEPLNVVTEAAVHDLLEKLGQ